MLLTRVILYQIMEKVKKKMAAAQATNFNKDVKSNNSR
jgi:hypothetical protein